LIIGFDFEVNNKVKIIKNIYVTALISSWWPETPKYASLWWF